MRITTRAGNTYYYDVLSDRISATESRRGAAPLPVWFVARDEFDFAALEQFTIEVTQQCNLRCRYCCYSGDYADRRSHSPLTLSEQHAADVVDFICTRRSPASANISVCFYGGEALLVADRIFQIIDGLEARCPDTHFDFSISTNGLLLTPEIFSRIASRSNISINITIDGSRAMHDANRVTADGRGSFDTIIERLTYINNTDPDFFDSRVGFLSTVRSIADVIPLNDFWMSHPLLRRHRPRHISSIIPNFDRGDTVGLDPEPFERVYDLALDHWREGRDNILTDELRRLVTPFQRRTYGRLTDRLSLTTCLNRPDGCFIAADGAIYPCERVCASHAIGHTSTGFDTDLVHRQYNEYLKRKNDACTRCEAVRLCRRCLTSLNFSPAQDALFCHSERMQLRLALRYYCEILESPRRL